jgi:type IX secretion system substrate protein/NHL repeat-containing protein
MKKFLFILIIVISSVVEKAQAQIINTIAGMGDSAGYTGNGGAATLAKLHDPYGVAVDKAGNVYIADEANMVIRKVNTAGIITTIVGTGYGAGTGNGGYNKPSGPATTVELNGPQGVAVDTLGNVYFCDTYNNIVRKLLTTGVVITIAGNASLTAPGVRGYGGDGGAATIAELWQPEYVAVDLLGNVYISDGNYLVRKVNTAGIIITIAGDTTGAGTGSNGGYSGDGGLATNAQLGLPDGVAVDKSGNVYIADEQNFRIRMVNTAGIISTFAGNGTQGYIGDGGQATLAELGVPRDIAVDTAGNIYIADGDNNVIRKVSTAGIITTVVGTGYGAPGFPGYPLPGGGFSGDGGSPTAAELWNPDGVAIDAIGNIYISDELSNTIRKVNTNSMAGIEQFTSSNEQVNIYPNPNNGSFVIEPKNTLYNIHYTMYDVNGKLVLSQTINGKTSIDASALNEGVYNISLQSNEGVVNKRLVIVR